MSEFLATVVAKIAFHALEAIIMRVAQIIVRSMLRPGGLQPA